MPSTRRRGAELRSAILEAVWQELVEKGYSGITFESIAERAQTSKPVIYRRWSTKQELLIAALAQHGIMVPTEPLDTGSLRGDVIAALGRMNRFSDDFAAAISGMVGAYFEDSTLTPAELRSIAFEDQPSGMRRIVTRAHERGEIDGSGIPDSVVSLPVALYRQELMMTMQAVPDAKIADIVDTLFLPLVRLYSTEGLSRPGGGDAAQR